MAPSCKVYVFTLLAACVLLLNGCAMFRVKVEDQDVSNMPQFDAKYGPQDLRKFSRDVSTEIAGSTFLKNQPKIPIMVIYGIQPRTTTYIDTQALTDSIRVELLQAGKVHFVNKARRDDLMKEQGYQAATATEKTRTAIGRQLGARFMLSGALVEMRKQTGRQVRVSKTELIYYQLTMDITDLETGIIVWSTQKEFARKGREPLFGW